MFLSYYLYLHLQNVRISVKGFSGSGSLGNILVSRRDSCHWRCVVFIFLLLTVALINPPESKESLTHLELAKHLCKMPSPTG